jgi:uncharacterized membrane protein
MNSNSTTSLGLGWPIVIENVTIQEFTLDGVKDLSQYPSFLFMYVLTTILFLTMIIFFSILSYAICKKTCTKKKIKNRRGSRNNILLEDILIENDPLTKL